MSDVDARYPIGRFEAPQVVTADDRSGWIADVAALPGQLRAAIDGLTAEQLDTPYRAGGWRLRQVVHHVPDSHLNAYIRFKLALTEDEPTIRPYAEARWAELADTATTPPEVSLALLEALHDRWVRLLRSMDESAYERTYRHPEEGKLFTLGQALAQYSWHGRHHVAHITGLRERMGWGRAVATGAATRAAPGPRG